MRNANINCGTLFLLNGFTFNDERIQEVIKIFTRQLRNAKDSESGYLVLDMRISFMSNKKMKENKVPLDLNYCPISFRQASLRGIQQSLSLIE